MSSSAEPREPRPSSVLCLGEVLWDVLVEDGSAGAAERGGCAAGWGSGRRTAVLGGAPFNHA